jgi:transposase-like protein
VSSGYITVKCPRCNSTSLISERGIRTEFFLCPVCLEGEIQYKVKTMLGDELEKLLLNPYTPVVMNLRAN